MHTQQNISMQDV